MKNKIDNLKKEWIPLTLEILSVIKEKIDDSCLEGCDTSIANLFLLQNRYGILFCMDENCLYRFYTVYNSYGFPIPLKTSQNDFLINAIKFIQNDNLQNNRPMNFCFCTQNQKNMLDNCIRNHFPSVNLNWNSNRNDSDYIYEQRKLATLSGKEYHKKKNHVSRFSRIYEGRYKFKFYSVDDFPDEVKKDFLHVAEKWFEEDKMENNESLLIEYEALISAIENYTKLSLESGILYVDDKPIAITLASKISSEIIDVIFEKSLKNVVNDGAYAAINKFFSEKCDSYLYINREEDMGIEGLRKAKLSYKPVKILDKFYSILS